MKAMIHGRMAWMLALVVIALAVPVAALADSSSVAPISGTAGTTFSFSTEGFDRSERVGAWFNAPNGTVLAVDDNSMHADGNGHFSYTWTSKVGVALGFWSFVVKGADSKDVIVTPFEITAAPTGPTTGSANVVPTVGASGTTFTFYMTGFSADERIGYWLSSPTGQAVPLDDKKHYSNGSGAFSVTWQAPSGTAPGTWQLVAQGTSSGIQQVVSFTVN